MKKYLALLLAAIMALSLAACASTAKTEDDRFHFRQADHGD